MIRYRTQKDFGRASHVGGLERLAEKCRSNLGQYTSTFENPPLETTSRRKTSTWRTHTHTHMRARAHTHTLLVFSQA